MTTYDLTESLLHPPNRPMPTKTKTGRIQKIPSSKLSAIDKNAAAHEISPGGINTIFDQPLKDAIYSLCKN